MTRRPLYDAVTRSRAAELYDEGNGVKAVSSLIGVPYEAVRQWINTYRSVGIEGLTDMGKKNAVYSYETKVAAARAVVDEGMTKAEAMEKFGIASTTPLKNWMKAYREGGPEALRPKPRGRRKGTSSPPKETTREQELERRIQKLEAEKRSRTERRRRP